MVSSGGVHMRVAFTHAWLDAHPRGYRYFMWRFGEPASAGIQQIAEDGLGFDFMDEVAACGESCSDFVQVACDPFSGTCTGSGTISATPDRPFLSLASMVAPSPDWCALRVSVPCSGGSGYTSPHASRGECSGRGRGIMHHRVANAVYICIPAHAAASHTTPRHTRRSTSSDVCSLRRCSSATSRAFVLTSHVLMCGV